MPTNINFKVLKDDTNIRIYGDGSPVILSDNQKSEIQSDALCPCSPKSKRSCQNCQNPSNINYSITVQDSDSAEHCHDEEFKDQIDKTARNKLWIASVLCVIFMIGEALGGIMAGSLAVATDAAHLLTDFAGFMISLFALYIAQRPATKSLSYGYHRAEVIGALTSVLLIWVITGILVFLAVERIRSQQFEIDAPIMLITSGVGVIVNIIMGCTLHQHHPGSHGHCHSHNSGASSGHSHGPHTQSNGASKTSLCNGSNKPQSNEKVDESKCSSSTSSASDISITHNKTNINVRAAFIHVIGDFLQSIGVFIAALIIYFKPEWVIVDPICTFLFSILVLGTTYAIMKDALVVLMEGIPKGIDFNDVRETLLQVKGVCKVHNLRIWALSMEKLALSAHLAIDPNGTRNANDILRKSSNLVKSKYGFSEVTIQIEDFNLRMQDCIKCQELN